MNRRAPAPPGVVTGARIWLLRHVAAGRVRWLPEGCEAWLLAEQAAEVTGLWTELVRSGWARVVPYDMSEPTPAAAETEMRPAGEDVLTANRKRKR